MRPHTLFITTAMTAALLTGSAAVAATPDYTKGVLIINEDWYGHQNSTVNHLTPDDPDGEYWHYRVIQAENPGRELGCTNQYGALWDGRLYLIAKQDKDPGATVTGGRITVCDAATLRIITQLTHIDPSGTQCDGRGFVGVDAHKGYISTSNGIWVFDLDRLEVTGQVEGSANPFAGDDRPNTDPTGSLYHAQSGSMVLVGNKVFAAHQLYGLLVIDTTTDKVVDTVPVTAAGEKAGIGSVVQSRDGMLWLSVAADVNGTGKSLPYLIRVNPQTLETRLVSTPDDIPGPDNSWYAWTPDAFCASAQHNVLYWKGGATRWFSGNTIYRYDIDADRFDRFIALGDEEGDWKIYGCSMRVHPLTDEIYMSVYHRFQDPTYVTRRYDNTGRLIREYPMITNYWFPSIPLFPEGDNGAVSPVIADPEQSSACDAVYTLQGIRLDTPWNQLPAGIYIRGGRLEMKR